MERAVPVLVQRRVNQGERRVRDKEQKYADDEMLDPTEETTRRWVLSVMPSLPSVLLDVQQEGFRMFCCSPPRFRQLELRLRSSKHLLGGDFLV
jgi:hypothetical protein